MEILSSLPNLQGIVELIIHGTTNCYYCFKVIIFKYLLCMNKNAELKNDIIKAYS
jgi:hypothetical protein